MSLESAHPTILAEDRERELRRALMRVKAARRRALPKLEHLSFRSPIVADSINTRFEEMEAVAMTRHAAAQRRLRVVNTEYRHADTMAVFALTEGTFERVLATLRRRRAAILYDLSYRGFVSAFRDDLERLHLIDGAIAALFAMRNEQTGDNAEAAQDRLDPDSSIAKLRANYVEKRARMLGAMCLGEITDDTVEFFAQTGALLRAIDLTPTDYLVEMFK